MSVFLFNVDLLEIDEAILKNLIIKDESKMIKLILTDMDGTFLNSKGDYNRELFEKVKKKMNEQGVAFAPVLANNVKEWKNYLVMMPKIFGF